jgi:hypothetical protein
MIKVNTTFTGKTPFDNLCHGGILRTHARFSH